VTLEARGAPDLIRAAAGLALLGGSGGIGLRSTTAPLDLVVLLSHSVRFSVAWLPTPV